MAEITEGNGISKEFIADQYLLTLITWRQSILRIVLEISKDAIKFMAYKELYSIIQNMFMQDIYKMLEYCRENINKENDYYELFSIVEEDLKFLTSSLDNLYDMNDA